jgi:hypothetical protein
MSNQVELLDIEVFQRQAGGGFNFSSAAIFDSAISMRIVWNYQSYDTFTLKVPLTMDNVRLFVPDNIILVANEYFYIDSAKVDKDSDQFMTVAGKSLLAKALMRIISTTYQTNSQAPESIAWTLLNKHVVAPTDVLRKVGYLIQPALQTSLTGQTIAYQNSYEVVMDQITNMMTSYDFGVRETPDNLQNPTQLVEFYKGADRSDVVEFSKEFDNLTTESYDHSNYDERTTAFVLGEGEGVNRAGVFINTSLSGLERKEIYIDARDLQKTVKNADGSETDLSDAQYGVVLTQRGIDKLANRSAVYEVNGTINMHSELYTFRKDFNVGDRVRITSTLFGLTKTAVLSSVEEVWETDHTLTPTFGNSSPTLLDIIKRR